MLMSDFILLLRIQVFHLNINGFCFESKSTSKHNCFDYSLCPSICELSRNCAFFTSYISLFLRFFICARNVLSLFD